MNIYTKSDSIVFCKSKDPYGEFGNMTGGFSFHLNPNILIRSSESLYQAVKFTNNPEIQHSILEQKSGFFAKLVAKKYKQFIREDWEEIKVDIMLWCLRLKIANYKTFFDLLKSTNDLSIVEFSKKDDFWGAKPIDENLLQGENVLGELLMMLRDTLSEKNFTQVQIPNVENLKILDFNCLQTQ